MELFTFDHPEGVSAGCCNWTVHRTFWLHETREAAAREIEENADDNREPHGLCSHCMADLIAEEGYEVTV